MEQNPRGTSVGNINIFDQYFTDDTVSFAESLEVQLMMAREALHEEAKPLELPGLLD